MKIRTSQFDDGPDDHVLCRLLPENNEEKEILNMIYQELDMSARLGMDFDRDSGDYLLFEGQ